MTAAPILEPPAADPLVGRTLGRYRLVEEIASGGMATVYLAHCEGLGGVERLAAVKVIHPHLARDPQFVEMFLDEARINSCVQHPNVCTVLDFGEAEGTYYLAMEYLAGETWSRLIHTVVKRAEAEELERQPTLLARVLAGACEGLHAAHEAIGPSGDHLRIVHRDVSPQNMFVGYDGTVKVLDFGIASAENRLHHTRDGAVKGRFAYMAPEQMRNQPMDRRADVWSLGVILWEGLAHARLFRRDSEAETIFAVAQEPIPLANEVRPEAPLDLARIAQKALSRNPDDRYATAREMGEELARFAARQSHPLSASEVSRWMKVLFERRMEYKASLAKRARSRSGTIMRVRLPGEPDQTGSQASATGTLPSAALPTAEGADSSCSTVRPKSRSARAWMGLPPIWVKPAILVAAVVAGMVFASVTGTDSLSSSEIGATESGSPTLPPIPQPKATPSVAQPTESGSPTLPATPPKAASSPDEAAAPPAAVPVRAATQSAAPAKPRFGQVTVVTPGGWAEVYAGRRRLGVTPGRFRLPAGRRVLRIRPFGEGPFLKRSVVVKPGGKARLVVRP